MRKRIIPPSSDGFTIVEVIIVLAVNGILLTSVLLVFGNGISNTSFPLAVNELKQQFQDIINETRTGYYPYGNTFSCSGATSPVQITPPDPSAGQGQNAGCSFLGKIIQLSPSSETGELVVYPLVGNEYGLDQQPSTTISGASPVAIAPNLTTPHQVDDTTIDNLENGLVIESAYADNGTIPIGAFGFLPGDSSGNILYTTTDLSDPGDPSADEIVSGNSAFSLYYVKGSSLGQSPQKTASNIDSANAANLISANNITVCVSGINDDSGLITISGGSLDASLTLKDGPAC